MNTSSAIRGNNAVTVATSVEVPDTVDLTVVVTDAPDPVFQGQNIIYNARILNLGTLEASAAGLEASPPAGG